MSRGVKRFLFIALALIVAVALTVAWMIRPGGALSPTSQPHAAAPVTRSAQSTSWQAWSQRIVGKLSARPLTSGFPQALPELAEPRTGHTQLRCNRSTVTQALRQIPGRAVAAVADNATGTTLYASGSTKSVEPASVMKLITASAALYTLGAGTRIQTTVVVSQQSDHLNATHAGKHKKHKSKPGVTVTIVGGGDPSLTVLKKNRYGARGTLTQLAKQTRTWAAQHNVTIRTVRYDTSLFSGKSLRKAWGSSVLSDGYTGHISALTLDAGRLHPHDKYSARSRNPARAAAQEFADRLGNHVKVKAGTAPKNAVLVGSVYSPKLSTILSVMLKQSDNVVAETIARLTAIQWGYGSDFSAGAKAARHVLTLLDVPTAQLRIRDGSGYGADDRLTATTIAMLLLRMGERQSPIHAVPGLLATSGHKGTLDDRFTANAHVPKGAVQAKTGSLPGVGAMAGFVTPRKGHDMVFSVVTNGSFSLDAPKHAIDKFVATLYRCGTKTNVVH